MNSDKLIGLNDSNTKLAWSILQSKPTFDLNTFRQIMLLLICSDDIDNVRLIAQLKELGYLKIEDRTIIRRTNKDSEFGYPTKWRDELESKFGTESYIIEVGEKEWVYVLGRQGVYTKSDHVFESGLVACHALKTDMAKYASDFIKSTHIEVVKLRYDWKRAPIKYSDNSNWKATFENGVISVNYDEDEAAIPCTYANDQGVMLSFMMANSQSRNDTFAALEKAETILQEALSAFMKKWAKSIDIPIGLPEE